MLAGMNGNSTGRHWVSQNRYAAAADMLRTFGERAITADRPMGNTSFPATGTTLALSR